LAASMYEASGLATHRRGQHQVSSRNADYGEASGANRVPGIGPRRSDLGFVRQAAGWASSPVKGVPVVVASRGCRLRPSVRPRGSRRRSSSART
jgi:hypothetical protein